MTKRDAALVCAGVTDILNMAIFSKTAIQWIKENLSAEGNLRDEGNIKQLVVLSNFESINSIFIHRGLHQIERLLQLNAIAIGQMKSLVNNASIKKLK